MNKSPSNPSGRSRDARLLSSWEAKYNLNAQVKKRDHYRCVYCGSADDITVDHVVPSSRGGDSSKKNLATACRVCNGRKGARTPTEAGMKRKRWTLSEPQVSE
jgi:5-methylcytosine-specific restriction endonuclease McrA